MWHTFTKGVLIKEELSYLGSDKLVLSPGARFAALAANMGLAPATILARGHIRRHVRHQQLMHFTWRL